MSVRNRLQESLGDIVRTDAVMLEQARRDRSGLVSLAPPIAVVQPRTIQQVQAVMRIATETHTPVIPRGAGTGVTGGVLPRPESVVLDLSGMNQIIEIDAENEVAVVEPGVIGADLDVALAPLGLWYPPDPASKAISTIGGNIATNAGGLLCAKYGVTREAVLGLTVVRADGSLLRAGHRTVKGVTGYDLTALLTGSEGTLGVIVQATLRVRPKRAGEPVTLAAVFTDVSAAAKAAAAITAARIRPAILELMDAAATQRIVRHVGAAASDPLVRRVAKSEHSALLIAQFDDEAAATQADAVAALVADTRGVLSLAPSSGPDGEQLLNLRRAFHPALAATGNVLIEDVVVPRSRMPEMFEAIARVSARYDIAIPTVAHAADGNLHPNFVFHGDAVPDSVWAAAGEIFRMALELGGTLTGEHGIGALKRRWLVDEIGEDSFALQREIKGLFDPLNILNPGVMF